MEVARLVLDYITVLIWPSVVISTAWFFRLQLSSLFDRVLHQSEQIDVEVAGQKVSIRLAEKVVQQALEASREAGTPAAVATRIERESTYLLRVLSSLDELDILNLRRLPLPVGPRRNGADEPQARRILSLGVAEQRNGELHLTELGQRVLSLLGSTNDVDEALHKITQAM